MERPDLATRPFPLWQRRVRRAVLARRRLLAAVVAALSVLVGLQAAAPPPPATRTVLTAAHDLAGGTVLGSDDVRRSSLPPESVPAGTLTAAAGAVGRTTTGPVRAGEPLTDVRLVSGSLLDGYPGLVAAPVRIGDAGAVSLLRVGDRVDVVAADPQGRADAGVVAAAAPVVALPRTTETALASGGLVVLAVSEDTATALASASVNRYLSVVVTH